MINMLLAGSSGSSSRILADTVLPVVSAASTPPASSDSASPAPEWLIIALLALVAVVIVAMFALTAFSLAAPRSTLKRVLRYFPADLNQTKLNLRERLLGRRTPAAIVAAPQNSKPDAGGQSPPSNDKSKTKATDKENASLDLSKLISAHLVEKLALAAKPAKRTARTTLAIAGFSLLGIIVVAMFGLSGQGVRDLRSQVVASVTTLVTAIAAFYFGAQTATKGGQSSAQVSSAPTLSPDHDAGNSVFTIGVKGKYTPSVGGQPAPTISLMGDELPAGLKLDPAAGTISGTPDDSVAAHDYNVTLIAHNGILPDARLPVRVTVHPAAKPATPAAAGEVPAAAAGEAPAAPAGEDPSSQADQA